MSMDWRKSEISFRALQESDLPLLQNWLAQPHIEAWWHEDSSFASVAAKYGPRIAGLEPTHVFIIRCGDQSIGWIQWYRWSDYPDHARQLGAGPHDAGIDLGIGEVEAIGQGLGPKIIRGFLKKNSLQRQSHFGSRCRP